MTRGGIGAGDDPGEQVAGREEVQMDGVMQRRTGGGGVVERREVEDGQAAQVEGQGGDRIGDQVRGPGPKGAPDETAVARRDGTQEKGDGGAENQGERGVHADQQVLVYKREVQGEKSFLILLNLGHRPCYYKPAQPVQGKIVVSTSPELEGSEVAHNINLGGDEGVIIELQE